MKNKATRFLLPFLAASLATLGWSGSIAFGQGSPKRSTNILQQGTAYFCDETLEHPTLVFRSDLGNARLIEFQYTGMKEWQPAKRCREIAERALEFHEMGIISYLTVEQMPNGTNAICISSVDAKHLELPPDFVRLLITLKPSDEPQEILGEIKGISAPSNDGEPLVH